MTEGKHIIQAILVDDEPHARENLRMMIESYCENVRVIATADSAKKATELVDELDPDLIFLDIMMPGKNGFAFLEQFDDRSFEVVFTTAHNEHALQAIKNDAVHYLEKPINIDDLLEAVARVEKRVARTAAATPSDERIARLLESISLTGSGGRTSVSTTDGIAFLDIEEIIHLEAQDQYTAIHLTGNRRMLSSKNIKSFEDKLNDHVFFRIHRSHIINMRHHLKAFNRTDGGVVVMSNGIEIPVSRRKLPQFMERIQTL